MNISEDINNIKSKISGKILENESLSKLSWFNIGGPAKVIFKPENLNDLSLFLKKMKNSHPIKVIGAGSNILIRDGGFNGIIIKFGKAFSHISLFKENSIISGASALDKSVSNFAIENSISGFEFLSCIPGTIGGAVRMNSGCYDEDISKILLSVQIMDFQGNISSIPRSKIKFHYRGSDLDQNLIFISATFQGNAMNRLDIEKKTKLYLERKKQTQPSKIKTCGSTFKNPKEKKAWKLIKSAGCIGMQVGEAQISEKHCNFFVNKGNAKSRDLEELINKVKKKVLIETGENLEMEIQIIGDQL